MDSSDDDPFHLSPLYSTKDDEKVENVEDLLEEAWFFGKLLATKPPKMSRCYSDPSPNFGQRLLPDNPSLTTCSSKILASGNLIRTPSLPARREEIVEEKESSSSSSKMRKLNRQLSDLSLVQKSSKEEAKESRFPRQKVITARPSKHRLLRTPSLPSPSCIAAREEEEEEEEDEDSDITMSRLIREAMPLSSQVLPPRSQSSKSMTQSCRPARNLKDLGFPNQRNLKESPSVVESQQVQGAFNQRDMNPSVVAILDKKKQEKADEDKVKRPYLSEAWYAKTCAPPPIPIWAKKNSAEDMKLQIKYWARAVASKAR